MFWPDTRLLHSQLDRTSRLLAAFHQANAVIGLASRSVTDDLSQDICAAGFGMFVFFENKHPTSLAQHKTVAIGRKGTRALFRRIVPLLGKDLHQDEAAHGAKRNRRVCAAGQNPVEASRLD